MPHKAHKGTVVTLQSHFKLTDHKQATDDTITHTIIRKRYLFIRTTRKNRDDNIVIQHYGDT